jgi:hypothetical protein
MKFCLRCDNCRWVCEKHPERPWEGPTGQRLRRGRRALPFCDRTDADTVPEMPEGFVVDTATDDDSDA